MAEVSFGDWLKRRRGAEGWTQQQLAQKINCSTSALRKMESEERRPSAQVVEELADLFKIPPNERKTFLRYARGDWQAFASSNVEEAPWSVSNTDQLSNLPTSITSFIGREKEQGEIINQIRKNRLVTIAGIGGIGKTRLALQVGCQLLSEYPDGVWFASFESLFDPLLVPKTVAAIFDVRVGPYQSVVETLNHLLHQKTLLLILDNCEHLLDACAEFIQSLLTYCPNLRILATSREILNIEGEATYYLPSLSTPEQTASLEKANQYEAVQLFVERASLAQSSFQLTEENSQTIAGICRSVDGIPLAIELTAARVNFLKVEDIFKQIQKSFAILAGDRRTTLPRHQTLQASLDWSWSLLSNAERAFLMQVSVFAGSWTLESAHAVCEGNVLDLTNALVKKSLVMVDRKSESGTRYHFHEIVRQYMLENLGESGETANIHTRHLEYFLQLSERAEPALKGPTQVAWREHLNVERDNIRAALAWAEQTDIEAGLYLSSRLHHFRESFDMREGIQWLTGFLQNTESRAYPLARAKALHVQGRLLAEMQQFSSALAAAQECLDLFKACGDRQGEIDGLLLLGYIGFVSDGQKEIHQQAIALDQEALALAQSIGDVWRQAYALMQLGWNYSGDEQVAYWEQAITLSRQSGDWGLLVDLLSILGNFVMLNGNFELAQKSLDEAAQLNNQLQNKRVQSGRLLSAYGRMAMIQGDYDQARTYLLEALEISEELGSRVTSLWCRSHLGYLALREGNITKAYGIFVQTAQNFQKDRSVIGVVFSLEGMAELYITVDKLNLAARLIGWADFMREKIGNQRPPVEQMDIDKWVAACLTQMGEVAFSAAYEEGKQLSMEKAIAYALEEN